MEYAELIDEAAEQAGLDPASLTSRHLNSIKRSFDLLAIELEQAGANAEYRQVTDTIIAPVSASVIPLPLDTIDVTTVAVVPSDTSQSNALGAIALSRTNRDAWVLDPNRFTTGYPSTFWVSKGLPQEVQLLQGLSLTPSALPTAYSWAHWGGVDVDPLTRNSLSIENVCLVLSPPLSAQVILTVNRIRQIGSPTGMGSAIDARRVWLPIICKGLAAKIAEKWNPERATGLAQEFGARLRARLEDENMHPVKIGFRGYGWSRERRHGSPT